MNVIARMRERWRGLRTEDRTTTNDRHSIHTLGLGDQPTGNHLEQTQSALLPPASPIEDRRLLRVHLEFSLVHILGQERGEPRGCRLLHPIPGFSATVWVV